MKSLLLVTHAPSPNTVALRDAVIKGAQEGIDGDSRVTIRALSAFDATPDDVLAADGYILGTTENLGYMSGALKDFFDRCYYPVLAHTQGRPYGVYIRAGHDGTGTKRAIETIVTGLRWRAVQEPLILRGDWSPDFIKKTHALGMGIAAGVAVGVF